MIKPRWKNPNWDKKVVALLKKQTEIEVAVGFPKGKANLTAKVYGKGQYAASVLDVAVWNNFGVKDIHPVKAKALRIPLSRRGNKAIFAQHVDIPARPFMPGSVPGIRRMIRTKVRPLTSTRGLSALRNMGGGVYRKTSQGEATAREIHTGFHKWLKKTGLRFDKFWEALGKAAVVEVRNSILNGNWKANAPLTINRKGSSKPLVDKGLMVKSVTHVVRPA